MRRWGTALLALALVSALVVPAAVAQSDSLGVPEGLEGEPAHVGLVRLGLDDVAGAYSYEVRSWQSGAWVALPVLSL